MEQYSKLFRTFIAIKKRLFMRYKQFEYIFSEDRMRKYVTACNGDTRRAMTLYRYNVKLSQEMFALVSYF